MQAPALAPDAALAAAAARTTGLDTPFEQAALDFDCAQLDQEDDAQAPEQVRAVHAVRRRNRRAHRSGPESSPRPGAPTVMTALLHEYDNKYQIYEDAEDMAIFFD